MMIKVAIIATHPIQYHIPWFRLLSQQDGIQFKVYFGCLPDEQQQGVGFGTAFKWDIPLLDGYDWKLMDNWRKSPSVSGFAASNVKNMRKQLLEFDPDVMLLTGWQALPLIQGVIWGRLLGIPCIVRGESNGLKPRKWQVRLVHRLLLSLYSAYLAIGKANRRFYESYGINENKIFPCNYFVENSRIIKQFNAAEPRRTVLREQWSIAPQSFCFLYMGKLNKKKRVMDQLISLKRALVSNQNLHLLVVGTGELMDEAQAYVKEHHLPVTFTGFLNQTEITNAFAATDCLVLSSDYDETWGLVVNEAMVSGLPAIVSDRAGSGLDLIENGKSGYLYPFADTEQLAQRMLDMAEDLEKAKEMGVYAKRLVTGAYSAEHAVDGTLQAIKSVITI